MKEFMNGAFNIFIGQEMESLLEDLDTNFYLAGVDQLIAFNKHTFHPPHIVEKLALTNTNSPYNPECCWATLATAMTKRPMLHGASSFTCASIHFRYAEA